MGMPFTVDWPPRDRTREREGNSYEASTGCLFSKRLGVVGRLTIGGLGDPDWACALSAHTLSTVLVISSLAWAQPVTFRGASKTVVELLVYCLARLRNQRINRSIDCHAFAIKRDHQAGIAKKSIIDADLIRSLISQTLDEQPFHLVRTRRDRRPMRGPPICL